MAEQFDLGNVIITFYAGPNKTQMVEIHPIGSRREFTLTEFLKVFDPIASELLRRICFGAPESAK